MRTVKTTAFLTLNLIRLDSPPDFKAWVGEPSSFRFVNSAGSQRNPSELDWDFVKRLRCWTQQFLTSLDFLLSESSPQAEIYLTFPPRQTYWKGWFENIHFRTIKGKIVMQDCKFKFIWTQRQEQFYGMMILESLAPGKIILIIPTPIRTPTSGSYHNI